MHPILIDFGFFALPTYGVLLMLGLVLALWSAKLRADRAGLPGGRVVDLGVWVVLWGVVGGKVLLAITDPSYLKSWEGIVNLLRAGGVFYGGLLGGLLAAVVLFRRYQLSFFPVADTLAPSISLGHAFGRLGCFAAGCCYGSACGKPWAVVFTNPKAAEISGTPLGVPLHPTQLYEAAFNFANYLFLAWWFRRWQGAKLHGQVFGAYLTLYSVARFIIEFFRGDADRGFVLGGLLSTSQAIAVLVVPLGIAFLLRAYGALRRQDG